MDGNAKVAIATLLSAVLTAGATIGAAKIGLVQPSEQQIVSSAKYKEIVDNSAVQIVRIGELTNRISTLEEGNRRLQREVEAAKGQVAMLESKLQRKTEVTDAQLPQLELKQNMPEIVSGFPKSEISKPKTIRKEILLRLGVPMVITDSLTITLRHIGRTGADIRINGINHTYKTPGNRINVSAMEDASCFVEVMSISSADANAQAAQIDMVCTPD